MNRASVDAGVTGILAQKLELLRQFCTLSGLMIQALDDEDMQKFNNLLGARQGVIDRVNDLDDLLANRGFAINRSGAKMSGGWTGETQQIINEIKACLTKAREMDRQIHTVIQQKYRDLVKNVGTVRVARQAEAMYRKKTVSRYGFFVDKKK